MGRCYFIKKFSRRCKLAIADQGGLDPLDAFAAQALFDQRLTNSDSQLGIVGMFDHLPRPLLHLIVVFTDALRTIPMLFAQFRLAG